MTALEITAGILDNHRTTLVVDINATSFKLQIDV